jgi:hypothetical protein
VSVLVTARDYTWEDYHSTENQAGGIHFLAKEISEHLNLYVQIPGTTMAIRKSGDVATMSVQNGVDYKNHESLLLIRQDLLDGYLKEKNLALILFAWGERRANYTREDARLLEGDFEISDAIHKQGFLYENGRFRRFL